MVLEMSSGMIRGLGTVVVAVAFIGLALWVFSTSLSAGILTVVPYAPCSTPPA